MPYVSLAVGAYYYCNVPARSRPAGDASRNRARRGAARLVTERFHLVDSSRDTPPSPGRDGYPYRELHCELWRPAATARATPLVVYSHGFMSSRRESLYLVRFLASHGYTVVAADFPLTGRRAPGKPQPEDVVNQPGDISCLIDHILERSADPGDPLYGCIDEDRIALAGLSFGGMTSLLTGYHRRWHDPRVGAVVSIAGPSSMFSRDFYQHNSIPALLIYGDADSVVHYDDHALTALERVNDATLVRLRRGSHAGFAQHASTLLRVLKNPDSLTCLALRMQMSNEPWDFVDALGGSAAGVVEPHTDIEPLTRPLVKKAMKASRQQMFTSLATHAFLESLFAATEPARRRAQRFLHTTLQSENAGEVSISR